MQYNLSGLFALPKHYLNGSRERKGDGERWRASEKSRKRQLSTGGKAALSLRACELNAEGGQCGKLLAGWLALTLPLWLSTAAENRGEVKTSPHPNVVCNGHDLLNDCRVSVRVCWHSCKAAEAELQLQSSFFSLLAQKLFILT